MVQIPDDWFFSLKVEPRRGFNNNLGVCRWLPMDTHFHFIFNINHIKKIHDLSYITNTNAVHSKALHNYWL